MVNLIPFLFKKLWAGKFFAPAAQTMGRALKDSNGTSGTAEPSVQELGLGALLINCCSGQTRPSNARPPGRTADTAAAGTDYLSAGALSTAH